MTARRAVLCMLLCVASMGCSIPRWPVNAPLTSVFGLRLRGIRPEVHRGVDLGVPEGTEVRAMAPGRVRFA
ncbi:MAG TPA: hypothetical protein VLA43_04555, partial [Longimicrobiales bacterium]|nr:hypothetical protein [Longimicrobiales bacterium]